MDKLNEQICALGREIDRADKEYATTFLEKERLDSEAEACILVLFDTRVAGLKAAAEA